MRIATYLDYIYKNQIPPAPPDGLTPMGYPFGHFDTEYYQARSECTCRGLWTVIDRNWTRNLANWIGNRAVLEVMAGGGWLAKALAEQGVNITATDDYSWDGNSHTQMNRVYPVQKMTAIKAVKSPADILLVSWPPYGDEAICRVCKSWGPDRPIIYIGEGYGGCNAPDKFWKHFTEIETPDFSMVSWDGIHDSIRIGHFKV